MPGFDGTLVINRENNSNPSTPIFTGYYTIDGRIFDEFGSIFIPDIGEYKGNIINPGEGSLIPPQALLALLILVVATDPQISYTSSYTYMITPTNPTSNICFPKGTLISCNQGEIPIEQINSDIHTIRGKQIVAITKTKLTNKYLICFEKDALGTNIPSKKTIMSENHKLFYNGKMIKALQFVNKFEKVTKIKYTGETLYNVLMENHYKMMVNNLICETLDPQHDIAKIHFILKNLNSIEQIKFIQEYNRKYAEKNVSKSLIKC